MKNKVILAILLSVALIFPTFAQAKGFSGGSHSSFSSSRSSSFSSRSNRSVNLSKRPSYSTKSYKISGRTSTVTSRTYTSTHTRTYYHGHYVTVSHYHSTSFYHPFSYYNGFTDAMIMSSFTHPWGGTYYVNGAYTSYGYSPLAWVIDLIVLLILLGTVTIFIKASRPIKFK